ncbi:MAG: hypothetical protein ACI94O_001902 [Octadecabacter sp.]|jgi:hypothetical protein
MNIANRIVIVDCSANNCRAVDDLRDAGEIYCENWSARLAILAGITA